MQPGGLDPGTVHSPVMCTLNSALTMLDVTAIPELLWNVQPSSY